ncbi:MAG: glycosyltransferase [bacterium]|nr:glycosyltransferase [bacterium]
MKMKKPHIILLFSDTGGGHRSVAEAIKEAIELKYPGQADIEMIDFIKVVGRTPLNKIPDLYPWMVRVPKAWELGFKITDSKTRAKLFQSSYSLYSKRSLKNFIRNHPCDLFVSTHFGSNAFLDYLSPRGPKMISVVTDLISAHSIWYDSRLDLCIVPSKAVYRSAKIAGLKKRQLKIIGLPISSKFADEKYSKAELKNKLNWPVNLPAILIMGGGFGHGPLEKIVDDIAKSSPKASLAVITGRNNKLKEALSKKNWPIQVNVYSFTKQIPQMMRCSDILITKAGSITLAEAFSASLPVILYDFLPGQEEGNVIYLVDNNAGVFAPNSSQIVSVVHNWLKNPQKLKRIANASFRLSQAKAADDTAEIIAKKINL